jgi:hypothetical protein
MNISPSSSGFEKTRLEKNQCESLPPAFTLVSFSAYFFDHEDGSDMFFRNVG